MRKKIIKIGLSIVPKPKPEKKVRIEIIKAEHLDENRNFISDMSET